MDNYFLEKLFEFLVYVSKNVFLLEVKFLFLIGKKKFLKCVYEI